MNGMSDESSASQVRERAEAVAAGFRKERFATKRELNTLSQLAAEAAKVFPPDFSSVNPADVLAQVSLITVACAYTGLTMQVAGSASA